jgi:hypothetical protein
MGHPDQLEEPTKPGQDGSRSIAPFFEQGVLISDVLVPYVGIR